MKKYNVAVVGATGAVGKEMMRLLELRNFPVNNIYAFASQRSAGKKLKFKNSEVEVRDINTYDLKKLKSELSVELALFSAGAATSKAVAPKFTEQGIFVIDNSSAWRMEPDIPLVVPEVNQDALRADRLLIANPNCSTIQMVVVLAPIHRAAKIKRIIVSTYQSVSGAGGRAMHQLFQETGNVVKKLNTVDSIIDCRKDDFMLQGKDRSFPVIAYQIAYNLIPQIDVFLENLYTKEEMKMVNETQKILSDKSIKVSATCVRVPVFRAHSETVWIETEKKISPEEVKALMKKSPGVTLIDNVGEKDVPKRYPMPLDCALEQTTYVGRIRQDLSCDNGLTMWIVSDNLLKGAALNAVEIAEALITKIII